ncbi:MAG: hypothetical protein Ct9H300mP27_00930 [Chloroflexota bacterium]|nr:MAG: hypothetical protein Ct9H300mP27_00930 [Chloroflexota bacterium]
MGRGGFPRAHGITMGRMILYFVPTMGTIRYDTVPGWEGPNDLGDQWATGSVHEW